MTLLLNSCDVIVIRSITSLTITSHKHVEKHNVTHSIDNENVTRFVYNNKVTLYMFNYTDTHNVGNFNVDNKSMTFVLLLQKQWHKMFPKNFLAVFNSNLQTNDFNDKISFLSKCTQIIKHKKPKKNITQIQKLT